MMDQVGRRGSPRDSFQSFRRVSSGRRSGTTASPAGAITIPNFFQKTSIKENCAQDFIPGNRDEHAYGEDRETGIYPAICRVGSGLRIGVGRRKVKRPFTTGGQAALRVLECGAAEIALAPAKGGFC